MKILIVEDDVRQAKALKNKLIRFGHEVLGIAKTSEEGIKKVDELKPDLAVLDIELDQGDELYGGIRVARHIITKNLGIEIIVNTSIFDERIPDELNKYVSNIALYVDKGGSDKVLKRALNTAIEKRETRMQRLSKEKCQKIIFSKYSSAFVVKFKDQSKRISLSSVTCIMASGQNSIIYGKSETELFSEVTCTLGRIASTFYGTSLVRINKYCILNMDKEVLKDYSFNEIKGWIKIDGFSTDFKISEKYAPNFFDRLSLIV